MMLISSFTGVQMLFLRPHMHLHFAQQQFLYSMKIAYIRYLHKENKNYSFSQTTSYFFISIIQLCIIHMSKCMNIAKHFYFQFFMQRRNVIYFCYRSCNTWITITIYQCGNTFCVFNQIINESKLLLCREVTQSLLPRF